jgi:hypothetical protein
MSSSSSSNIGEGKDAPSSAPPTTGVVYVLLGNASLLSDEAPRFWELALWKCRLSLNPFLPKQKIPL